MKYQDYTEFKKGVLNHLGDMNPKPWGVFSGNGKAYPHIAYIPSDKTQEDVIKSILIKDRVEPDLFLEATQICPSPQFLPSSLLRFFQAYDWKR